MLEWSTAVITGAGSGLGRAMALAFARQRMNIVLASIHRDRPEKVAAEVASLGVETLVVTCDASVRPQVMLLAAQAYERFCEVHLLCNNAGVTTIGPFLEQSDDDWD